MSLQRNFLEIILKLKEKRRSLISNRVVTNLIAHYGGSTGHNLDLGKKNDLGYGFLHYALITNFKPKNVLCIGSGQGFIPAICALACKNNKTGHVDFVDAGFDKDNPNSWGGTGFWKKVDPEKHFGFYDLHRWLDTYVMKSADFQKMGTRKKWQYIYLDADHSYKGIKNDFSLFWPRLEKGGLVVFHDVLLKKHPEKLKFGVWKFWKELKNKNKITIPYTIPWGTPSGLGIIQKT